MSDMPTLPVVDDAERFLRPREATARGRLALAALAAVLIEGAVVGLIFWERPAPSAPELVEIPVEMIPEPPPEPPPPSPQAQAEPPQPQETIKPATDAPREGKSDHDDEHVAEKETPAAAPPPAPAPTPSTEPSPPAEAAAPDLPKAPEPDAPEPLKTETPKPAAPPKPSVLAALPKTYEDVPNIEFGGAAIRSPVTGGAAKSTYLSQLYGLIVQRLHVPALAHAYGRSLQGAIAFGVDGHGRLMQRYVAEPSGSTELDEAAMEAVSNAAKTFPPPPKNAAMGMKFTYSVN